MIAALGVASRPVTSRTRTRKTSSTRSQVPSSRHFRKYHQTVPQGGRSWGISRQGMPPRSTYRMPLTTSPGLWFWDGLWWCRAAAGEPIRPTGHRSNRWGNVFYSCPQRNHHPILTPRTASARLGHCHTPSKADIQLLHQQGRSATRLAEDYRIVQSTIYKAIADGETIECSGA